MPVQAANDPKAKLKINVCMCFIPNPLLNQNVILRQIIAPGTDNGNS
jgi:hypothetical protein